MLERTNNERILYIIIIILLLSSIYYYHYKNLSIIMTLAKLLYGLRTLLYNNLLFPYFILVYIGIYIYESKI